jgi:hypothetical protein
MRYIFFCTLKRKERRGGISSKKYNCMQQKADELASQLPLTSCCLWRHQAPACFDSN